MATEKKKLKPLGVALLNTLENPTEASWDKFYTDNTPSDDPFEWHAEWSELKNELLDNLPTAECQKRSEIKILVPACGDSKLSENLYGEGFTNITNVDFSKVLLSVMLRKYFDAKMHSMGWIQANMTDMEKIKDMSFDVVLDKGGLDSLMEPEHNPSLRRNYVAEVKRVLKNGGRFICITFGESHVLGMLFPLFRHGWLIKIILLPQKKPKQSKFRTFMVIAERLNENILLHICMPAAFQTQKLGKQVDEVIEAVRVDNRIRDQYYDLLEVKPGCMRTIILGGPQSIFCHKGVVLDNLVEDIDNKSRSVFWVIYVPAAWAVHWSFSTEEGQRLYAKNCEVARVLLIFLDQSQTDTSSNNLDKLFLPFLYGLYLEVKQMYCVLLSSVLDLDVVLHQVESKLTGKIVVGEKKVKDDVERTLVFNRSPWLARSAGLLKTNGSQRNAANTNRLSSKKKIKNSKLDKKGTEVDHRILRRPYTVGIVAGITLISSYLNSVVSSKKKVRAVVVGLGAGLLPMFLHRSFPFLHVEAAESDETVFQVAKDYFGFQENEHLKVHIIDGIKFVKEKDISTKVDILIVDVESPDSSSGIDCPAEEFVREPFLTAVKRILSDKGLFVINLLIHSPTRKEEVISRIKSVFSELFSLDADDENQVIIAPKVKGCTDFDLPNKEKEREKVLLSVDTKMQQGILAQAEKIEKMKMADA